MTDDSKELIKSFIKLNKAVDLLSDLDNLYSAYGFQIKSKNKDETELNDYKYAINCIEEVKKVLKEYEEHASANSNNSFLDEKQISEIRLKIEGTKQNLEKRVSKK